MKYLPEDDLILNLAPTGMVPTRSQSAEVPLQPNEIINDVLNCAEIGISSVHLHARDERGIPTFSKEIYARIIGGIREKRPDLIICVSCSGRGGITFEERTEVLTLEKDLRPDMASLTLSSMNFSTSASINSPDTVMSLAIKMRDDGIKPELEIFDLGMANVLSYLITRDVVSPPYYANLILGNLASAQARLLDIGSLEVRLPTESIYCLGGLGHTQHSVAGIAAAIAPGVRIGLEDNIWLDRQRTNLASNRVLVQKVHSLAALHNRTVMSPSDLRIKLGLQHSL